MKFKSYIPAIAWLLISTFLLCLPGNDLPHIDPFPNFDKVVHISMFFLLTALCCYPSLLRNVNITNRRRFINIGAYILAYGILIEFVQKFFIRGRSFDVLDILSDGVGSFAATIAMIKILQKKIGPDRNRGRNQN